MENRQQSREITFVLDAPRTPTCRCFHLGEALAPRISLLMEEFWGRATWGLKFDAFGVERWRCHGLERIVNKFMATGVRLASDVGGPRDKRAAVLRQIHNFRTSETVSGSRRQFIR